jgi:hypothetical protein
MSHSCAAVGLSLQLGGSEGNEMSVRCETRIECETSARDDHAPPPRDRAHLEIRQNRVRFVMCAARERGLELLQLVHGGGLQHEERAREL